MIVAIGGHPPRAAARRLQRAIHSIAPVGTHTALTAIEAGAPRRFALSARQQKIERERMRQKIEGTKMLAAAIETALTMMRAEFLLHMGIREGNDRPRDISHLVAGLDFLRVHPKRLADAFRAPVRVAFNAGRSHAYSEIIGRKQREGSKPAKAKAASVATSFDLTPQAALDALYQRHLVFAKHVVDREKVALKGVLMQSLADGDGSDEVADNIRGLFVDGMHVVDDAGEIVRTIPQDSWIDQVARTEISRANNAGVVSTYVEAGVETLIWLAAEDERTCPTCEDLDGAIAALGDPFPGTDATEPPEHTACRCTVIAGPDDAGEITSEDD